MEGQTGESERVIEEGIRKICIILCLVISLLCRQPYLLGKLLVLVSEH